LRYVLVLIERATRREICLGCHGRTHEHGVEDVLHCASFELFGHYFDPRLVLCSSDRANEIGVRARRTIDAVPHRRRLHDHADLLWSDGVL
jgi:hypothetical protein